MRWSSWYWIAWRIAGSSSVNVAIWWTSGGIAIASGERDDPHDDREDEEDGQPARNAAPGEPLDERIEEIREQEPDHERTDR